jgi:transglycosylase-like protein with SLT domain
MMRQNLAVSCLFAFFLVATNASANVDPDLAGLKRLDVSPLDAAEGLLASQADDEPGPADSPKDPTRTSSLERAKAALAESNAQAPSHDTICTTLVAVAQRNELPVGFLTNLIWRESRFDHQAISRVGAMGIAQFMPDVADTLGLDAFETGDALPASGRLLRTLRARFGNLGLAAAAYNAGPKRVLDWLKGQSGLPSETREYVSLVTGRPAEQWRDKARAVVFQVPRRVPCHKTPTFASVEEAERAAQIAKVAEEKRIEEERKRIAEARKLAEQKAREAALRKHKQAAKVATGPRR